MEEAVKKEREFDIQIRNMEKEIQEQKNINEKLRMEQEKIRYEERQKEEQRKIKEIQEKQKAISQCKEYLTEEFMESVSKAFKEFRKIESNWIKQIPKNDIENRKKELSNLFNQLFESEKIKYKIENKFNEQFNKNYVNKKLTKMNFMIIGASGVGKSTLINALLRDYLAEEGLGGVCTTEIKKYESQKFPFICLYDSVGAELGKNHTLEDIQNETINVIVKQLSNPDNLHIHCIFYCVISTRFFDEEAEIILKIRAKYDDNKLPIVIAYTMGSDNRKYSAIKERINKILKKIGESITENRFDSFGIYFLPLYAKEADIKVSNYKYYQKSFGLSDLISICYEKGKESYKIAIKNSLKQIARDYIVDYINNISNKIKNVSNIDLFLEQNFEPNFSDFISFLFEKIAYVDNCDNNNNVEMTLKSNLNYNSKNEITNYIEQYKNEMLKFQKKNLINSLKKNHMIYILVY